MVCIILISLQIGKALSIIVLQIPNYILPLIHARLFVSVAGSHSLGFFLRFRLLNVFFTENQGDMSQKYIVLRMCTFWIPSNMNNTKPLWILMACLTKFVDIGFKAEKEHIFAAGNTGRFLSLNYFLWYENSPFSIIPRCLCKSF